ncbi:E1 protein [Pudu puda papillomavirus 1]|uniref:Replication protein E1 n=2 Tax=Pudu puda papillomavirus 1 TaxID=1747360 RepID=A0A1I9KXY4_9PAPI|nr:E1 protein [Pudu puda papillomavirus 1]ALP46953.1 E1 protein [Pudu puda papillomavirus 1]
MAEKGTDGDWFIVREADCSDLDSEEQGPSAESEISDLFDDSDLCQGNSLQLFHQQEGEQQERQLQLLKRKFLRSPKEKVESDLSPRLDAITISPEKQTAKRRLFEQQHDSGLDLTVQYEAPSISETQEQVATAAGSLDSPPAGRREEEVTLLATEILKSSNRRATQLCKFKETVGVSFTELTRSFQNDKTCGGHWVVAVFDVSEQLYESLKTLLQTYCTYFNMCRRVIETGSVSLMLLSFKANKCRETVIKLLKSLLQVEDYQLLAEPPRLRSTVAALFWFKSAFSPATSVYGEAPEWMKKQTLIGHQTAEELTFDFSDMVQWAWDNGHTEEAIIAFEYAKYAEENNNAMAWLNSNNQAKYVKDCATMVKYYRTAEMRQMTMSAWIAKRCRMCREDGDWKPICKFLKFQNVEIPMFMQSLKWFLKGIPKKNCLVFYGPPNTGKSMFTLSLMRFLGGKVLSFANHASHFWLQPLNMTKIALIDDATNSCWDYIDVYLRNALDGNEVCIDVKHRAPVQIKCPPLLITTNVNIRLNDKWRFLYSRINQYEFPNEFPFNEDGTPVYALTDTNWKSFFKRLWTQLELSDQEEEGEDGDTERSFRCGARRTTDIV